MITKTGQCAQCDINQVRRPRKAPLLRTCRFVRRPPMSSVACAIYLSNDGFWWICISLKCEGDPRCTRQQNKAGKVAKPTSLFFQLLHLNIHKYSFSPDFRL